MCTSVVNQTILQKVRTDSFLTAGCAIFGAIYEKFSHEVYSYYMLYAFLIPLLLGVIPLLCIGLSQKRQPGTMALKLYHSGIFTLTTGSLFQGILEIYGTTNRLSIVYLIAGVLFLLAGILHYALFSVNVHRFAQQQEI